MNTPKESTEEDRETLESDDDTSGGGFIFAVNGIRAVRDQITGYVEPATTSSTTLPGQMSIK